MGIWLRRMVLGWVVQRLARNVTLEVLLALVGDAELVEGTGACRRQRVVEKLRRITHKSVSDNILHLLVEVGVYSQRRLKRR